MKKVFALAVALATTAPAAYVAHADGEAGPAPFGELTPAPYVILCGAAETISGSLRQNGEVVAAHGVSAQKDHPGLRAQFWVNPETHDWTMVYVDAVSGMACMIAAGSDFAIDRVRSAPAPRNAL